MAEVITQITEALSSDDEEEEKIPAAAPLFMQM